MRPAGVPGPSGHRLWRGWLAIALLAAAAVSSADEFAVKRGSLVETLRSERRSLGPPWSRSEFDPRVLRAIGNVPRHEFVDPKLAPIAYEDRPLPIGHGQTISQPLVVALMSEELRLEKGSRVLEVGTGSGYQAAVLAELGAFVYTVETIGELADSARRRLTRLGYPNVHVRTGDGYRGWPEASPFDAIIVTAAAPEVPGPLLTQLRTGGRMVIPVGAQSEPQQLRLITKRSGGLLETTDLLPVAFVPLIRPH
ncbi:MAG: protein-L-isoaspartate(D-aspartate) O-methyltransferase [Methylotetracoccus sp.]